MGDELRQANRTQLAAGHPTGKCFTGAGNQRQPTPCPTCPASAWIAPVPAVSDAHETQFARGALDDERLLDVVEQAHALGIERMGADEILAGQERKLRKGE